VINNSVCLRNTSGALIAQPNVHLIVGSAQQPMHQQQPAQSVQQAEQRKPVAMAAAPAPAPVKQQQPAATKVATFRAMYDYTAADTDEVGVCAMRAQTRVAGDIRRG
jgi:hypothetical protein